MTMTTQDGTKIGERIITDVNANIPGEAPRATVVSPEAAMLFNKAIIARPLLVPEVCSLRVKDSGYRYRWVNRDALGGRIFTQRRAQGFINATNDDVDVMSGDAETKDGEIRAGDLILMKIRADLYDAAMKFNMQKAYTYQRARGMHMDGASSDVFSDATATRHSVAQDLGARTGQARPFIPDNPDAIVDDSVSSGRVAGARETVEGLRKGAKSKE